MLAKMAANAIRTHARTNQWRTLESRSRQSLNAGRLLQYNYNKPQTLHLFFYKNTRLIFAQNLTIN